MGMGPEFAAPGMKNAIESYGCSQAVGIIPKIQEGLGTAFKQQVIHDASVILAQRIEHMGQGKDTMVVGYRQQLADPCLNPSVPGNIIASGTMAVPAGIISFFQVTAGITDCPVGAEFTAPAMLDIIHDLVLPGVEPVF